MLTVQPKNTLLEKVDEAATNASNANKPKTSRSAETVTALQDLNLADKNDNAQEALQGTCLS